MHLLITRRRRSVRGAVRRHRGKGLLPAAAAAAAGLLLCSWAARYLCRPARKPCRLRRPIVRSGSVPLVAAAWRRTDLYSILKAAELSVLRVYSLFFEVVAEIEAVVVREADAVTRH